MADLWSQIQQAVADERYLVSQHAAKRLEERGIIEWQVVVGTLEATIRREREQTRPHPSVEVSMMLPAGTPIKAIRSWISTLQVAKLVTVHYFDEN